MAFKILGTGRGVPSRLVTNDELAQYMDTSDEWISQRTGIKTRYISEGMGTTDMAEEAARSAMEMAGVTAQELDLIIVGTVSPDHYFPSAACEVQARLGAENAIAFDVSAGCTGFLYVMQVANAYFSAGDAKKALIIGAETLSKMMDWGDRSTCVLFGDGAGACVIEAAADDDDKRRVTFVSGSDGSRGNALICAHRSVNNLFVKNEDKMDYTHMDGQAVFKFAVRTVPTAIEQALEKAGITADDVDMYLLHQANIRIIESVAKRLDQPIEKFPIIMQEYGNISAGSVPLLTDIQVRSGSLKRGMKVVMAGFGAGLTWSACVLTF